VSAAVPRGWRGGAIAATLTLALAATLALALAATAAAGGAPRGGPAPTAAEAEALGKAAYDYGLPLLEFIRVRHEQTSVRCPDSRGNAPVNSFSNARGFATADDRTVVAPNTDTLYSIAHLDLGRGPIVLGWPRMGKRYFSFELLDPYTNVIDIRGTRKDGGDADRVEIRWRDGPGAGKPAPGTRVIESKYRRVWIIGRTLATDERDQRRARKLMARYVLERPNGRQRSFPRNCRPGAPDAFPTPSDGPGFVAALNRQLERNPPPRRDRPLLRELRPLGIGPGLAPQATGLEPEVLAALGDGVAQEAASLPTAARLSVLAEAQRSGGWLLPAPNIGDYGTDYLFRAQIAVVGLGANTPDEAIYPVGITDAAGALLNGANDYRLTIAPGEEPPAKYFWSLTMYDTDGYLVANPIDRYSLGPSHPPLVRKPDRSIEIAISQREPSAADVNWLPAPPAGFRLNLRLYGPSKAARKGQWRPPPVVNLGPAAGP
jgi:hypothetical protein